MLPFNRPDQKSPNSLADSLLAIVLLLIISALSLAYTLGLLYQNVSGKLSLPWPSSPDTTIVSNEKIDNKTYWKSPNPDTISEVSYKELVLYGKSLIAETAKYLGPEGIVFKTSNGMNCQNCHLDAGTKIFGNNYSSVASTYPKFRARSGTMENIYKRVNDCFERSLNGEQLDTLGKEMQAIKAYIEFIGSNVKKGDKPDGSGLKNLTFIDRAADPIQGEKYYVEKCQICHGKNGEGIKAEDNLVYTYPPLWGQNSYNDAAGLYRVTNFAKYIKYNMPLGASYLKPMLTDDEAWDIAAFVNSQPRPHKNARLDWPDISKKPIDHPFGPYKDSFSINQHKFGPFKPIAAFYEKIKTNK